MGSPEFLIAFGILFLAGLALDSFGRRVHVPRVTLLIMLGAVVGPPVLDLLPAGIDGASDLLAPTALTMVAFLLGSALEPSTLRAHGREIIVISLTAVIVSVLVIAFGLILVGVPVASALLLGGISAATDPAATRDVVQQSGATGRFPTNLLGIVAIDDAWGLIAFSIVLTIASVMTGGEAGDHVLLGLREAGGAVALGLAIGLPAAYLTGRIKPGEPTLIEALGLVFLCAGLAIQFGFSFLLAGMVCGATIVNFASHHERPINEIERIEWPFMLLFFVMAGASLETTDLAGMGLAGIAYVVLRFASRILGGWLGGRLAGLPGRESRLTGLALMPQAGVAIGMALVAAERFPDFGRPILAITIASTIAFELIGPLMTQIALARASRDAARNAAPH
ncbi:cation:proton antiporter [Amaricoccus sp.]|uniref:cation:proton antiporter n=1 Tax=Amaricoccus sp. TaxID=1872485 RepID=UPI002C045380|nr:cation:proton antiporter [Amaricoccus sp.]HRW15367.1 cation:proton antiporter [Amaricoccus sp.]